MARMAQDVGFALLAACIHTQFQLLFCPNAVLAAAQQHHVCVSAGTCTDQSHMPRAEWHMMMFRTDSCLTISQLYCHA